MSALEVRSIDKSFGATHAVKRASLAFERGQIHAVVGENGAGKSTLLRLAAGLLTPDAGEAWVEGAVLSPHTPAEALRRGVAMVQQHFALVDVLTALENVVLGAEPRRGLGVVNLAAARAKASGIAKDLGAEIAWDARTLSLGVGDKQRLEIVRALYRDARVVILDEPTAVLTPGEAKALYGTLRRLAEKGCAVVVVTHKLDEVRDHADVVTVMRQGEIVTTREALRTAEAARGLATMIMGSKRGPPETTLPSKRKVGEPVLVIDGAQAGLALRGVSITVKAGEIVGIAGVEGNGQRELVRAIGGLDRLSGGTINLRPEDVAVVYEDRQSEGLVLDASIRDNLLLGELARFARRGVLDEAAMDREAHARTVRADGSEAMALPARALSGGYQQKIVIARAIARLVAGEAKALVLAHPTRGVDLASSRAIRDLIVAAASRQAAVLVVSADLYELADMADRILVFARGRVSAEFPPTASEAEIGRAMLAIEGQA